MVKLTPKSKKWLLVLSLAVLSAYNMTTPINLRGLLPEFVLRPYIFGVSLLIVASAIGLISIYWLLTKQID